MSIPLQNRRKTALELLSLLASPDQQLAYERDVPAVDVTTELQSMWFDDFYDAKRAGSDRTFSEAERTALARFHDAYRARIDRLPPSKGTVRTWLENPIWKEIMQAAARTIDQIAPL